VVRDDAEITDLRELIVTDTRFMATEEAERIRDFVRGGGTLIATGLTSLLDIDGTLREDFQLADVLGISYSGQMSKRVCYLYLEDGQNRQRISEWVSCNQPSPMVSATTANVIAYLAEPLFDPDDPQHWTSIHSNPPGKITEYAAFTENQYGKGKCVYLAPAIFGISQDAQKCFNTWLLDQYLSPCAVKTTNAPPCVEITILKSTTKKAYIICFVNYQRELPNIPIRDLYTRVELPTNTQLVSIRRISDGVKIVHGNNDDINLQIPILDTLEMFTL